MSEIRTDTINNASGDNDSGIDLSTNDQVSIKTANTTALTVDASQNVGIGESSPSSTLVVGGNATTTAKPTVAITDTTSGATMAMRGQSPKIAFDVTSSGVPKILMDNAGLEFKTGTLDAEGDVDVKIDSSGNLLVSTTVSSGSNAPHNTNSATYEGFVLGESGSLLVGSALEPVGQLNAIGYNGDILRLRKDGTTVGSLGVINGNNLTVGGSVSGHGGIQFGNNNITPMSAGSEADNAVDLGASNLRYDDIYATNSSIQTSDRNEKQDIEELSDAEQRVAVACKGLMRKYRWRDSVAKKGDNARTHFGIIAQDLQDAFTAEGLDAGDYAMFTSNTWWEKEISVDAVEADEENGIEAKDAYTYIDTKEEATEGYTEKTRLGVRYSELLAFIISAL
jgi:hypothetical protein